MKVRVKNSIVKLSNRKKILKTIIFFILLLFLSLSIFLFIQSNQYKEKKLQLSDLEKKWQNQEYAAVYASAKILLDEDQYKPEYNFYYGMSAFYLALEQIDLIDAQRYIEEAIFSFRKALHRAKKKDLPVLHYLLGKSYFQKNSYSASYFYADLAVIHLKKAEELGFFSSDIPEYLGLSYALLHETEASIRSFSQALSVRESDVLLLAIAQQYLEVNNYAIAKQYIHLAINKTKNEQIVLEANLLLAHILFTEKAFDEALELYTEIISVDEDNADAYFGIGLIYEEKGDLVRARAQWRRVLNIQINHSGAIQKLSL